MRGASLKRRLSWMTVLGLLLQGGAPQAGAATDLCDPIITHLRRGEAHRRPEDSVLGALASDGGWLKLAKTSMSTAQDLKRLRPTQELAAALPDNGDAAELAWLVPGRIGMINDVQGTLHCSNLTFFAVEGGRARKIPPPRGLRVRGAHLCWTNGVRVASVEGQPALVEEDGDGAPWTVELQAFPWADAGWGKPCRLTARFTAELAIDTRHCTAGAACGGLEAEALRLARRREYHQPLAPADPRFRTLAAKTTALEELPAKDGTIAYGHFAAPQLVSPRQAPPGVVAVIGGGSVGWRDYEGHIVAFWQETPDGGLTPLAGYQIGRRRGALTGVKRLP